MPKRRRKKKRPAANQRQSTHEEHSLPQEPTVTMLTVDGTDSTNESQQQREAKMKSVNWRKHVFSLTNWEGVAVILGVGVLIWQIRSSDVQSFNEIRPWVSIKHNSLAVQNLRYQPGGLIHAEISYVLENSGDSPALSVWGGMAPYASEGGQPDAGWMTQQCTESERRARDPEFPKFFIPRNGEQDAATVVENQLRDQTNVRFVWAVGCIVYHDAIRDEWHYTRLVYRGDPATGAVPLPIPNTNSTYVVTGIFQPWSGDTD